MKKTIVIIISSILLSLMGFEFKSEPWKYLSMIPDPIRKQGRIVLRNIVDIPYYNFDKARHSLPVYEIEVDARDLEKIHNNIPKPSEYLTDEYREYIPIAFDGDKAKMRLRGWARNHWLWDKKSYKIKRKGGDINLIVPFDRAFLIEEVNNIRARNLGLIVPHSEFVVADINGTPRVYWAVEQLGDDMLEKQGLEGYLYGEAGIDDPLYTSTTYWKSYNGGDFVELGKMLDLLNNSTDTEFFAQIFDYLDEETFLKWSVHREFVKSPHQDATHNARLFYDGKFKMIPWDVEMGNGEPSEHPIEKRILSNIVYLNRRDMMLEEYTRTQKEVETYDALWEQVKVAYYQDDITRFSNWRLGRKIESFRERLKLIESL